MGDQGKKLSLVDWFMYSVAIMGGVAWIVILLAAAEFSPWVAFPVGILLGWVTMMIVALLLGFIAAYTDRR